MGKRVSACGGERGRQLGPQSALGSSVWAGSSARPAKGPATFPAAVLLPAASPRTHAGDDAAGVEDGRCVWGAVVAALGHALYAAAQPGGGDARQCR